MFGLRVGDVGLVMFRGLGLKGLGLRAFRVWGLEV